MALIPAMLAAIATCLMLLALGLPGVLALRRLTDRLTALEQWVYGLPLGAVVGSLARKLGQRLRRARRQ